MVNLTLGMSEHFLGEGHRHKRRLNALCFGHPFNLANQTKIPKHSSIMMLSGYVSSNDARLYYRQLCSIYISAWASVLFVQD